MLPFRNQLALASRFGRFSSIPHFPLFTVSSLSLPFLTFHASTFDRSFTLPFLSFLASCKKTEAYVWHLFAATSLLFLISYIPLNFIYHLPAGFLLFESRTDMTLHSSDKSSRNILESSLHVMDFRGPSNKVHYTEGPL